MMIISALCALGGAYICGALPIGFWVAQWRGIADIRYRGSGNIGATNIARFLGLSYFIIVLILDAGKAYSYLKILQFFHYEYPIIIGSAICLLIGNGYSFFIEGHGGKGIATTLGIVLALKPNMVVIGLIGWIICLAVTHTIGIASVLAACMGPWYAWFMAYDTLFFLLSCFIAVWVLFRHSNNIRQYMQ
jgi:glycerol-3-phosphate acyltransferase PlsY